MNQDADSLEYFINLLLGQFTGQTITSLAVPQGLQQIFDRRGIIGTGSYDFANGSSASFSVAAGAYWSGSQFYLRATAATLSMAGKTAGTYYLNLDAAGNPLVGATADATTSRQFYWDGANISAKALYAGVAILFDGDDYADMLTSAARGKTFTKVADRMEEIEVLLGKAVQTPASADTININWSLGGHAQITLNRPRTTFAFSGGYDRQRLVLELIQDPQGGRQAAFGAEVAAGSDLPFPVPLSEANKRDFIGFIYSASTGEYYYTSLARGFNA
jgi:hypothetical protein